MVGNIEPTGSGQAPYRPEYKNTPGFQKMWNQLFNQQLTSEQSAQLTDGYMKLVNDYMNKLAQKAIDGMKKRRRQIESGYQEDIE